MSVLTAAAIRAELPPLLRLSWPIVGAQLAFMAIGVTDTILAGHLSARDLAAVAVGANLWMLFFVGFMGICMAMSPMVAQLIGQGRDREALAGTVQHGMGLALPAPTEALAIGYLRAAAFAAPLNCLAFMLRYAAEGAGNSRPVLFAGVLAFVVNAVADYGFMYGAWGLPAMGAVGCGWATALASVAMFASLALSCTRRGPLREFSPWRRPVPGVLKTSADILRLGVPIALIWLAEAGLFAGAGLLAARLGEVPAAAHQIAINVAAVAFMVPMGIGLAATARVGQAAGAGRPDQVAVRSLTAIGVAVLFAAASALCMLLLPRAIVGLYTDAPAVLGMASGFLFYAALFQLFDCVQATASGCLRGLKDTRGPMWITVTAYWIVGLPLGAGGAFALGFGPDGLWYGLIAGLAVAAVGLSLRLRGRLRRLARQSARAPGGGVVPPAGH